MQPQTSIHEPSSNLRQNNLYRKTRKLGRPKAKQNQTNQWSHSPLEILSALLLPITLLVLLLLIAFGLTETLGS